jgi:hypothetical protein
MRSGYKYTGREVQRRGADRCMRIDDLDERHMQRR